MPDDRATEAFAQAWARVLRAGDVVLLEGGIGAGKTAFARALIQSRLAEPEDVPSPTFTLVQTYDTPDFEIWHCDLYRVSGPGEVIELGLEEAMETALCLIEWPERLGDLRPADAVTLTFAVDAEGSGRDVAVSGLAERWASRVPAWPA
ncbi:hypothetical protein ATO11_10690 [Pseudaestuariivita atlantica]|uniref:tRNA threonylcarbamoyladenosine biosynthesis protein TsaE n=1 Tax=Pseudaestuariivita atlantica TaxID=1317121 RepID=A0A0L1JQ54_9RHOB|nr:hypothetical protein ATO11_10690 [Pseudaestuariivita atlantica]